MTVWSRLRRFSVIAALLALAAAAVSIALGYPKEVTDPVLGEEWHCSRIVVLTSCTRIPSLRQRGQTSPVLLVGV